MNYRKICSFLGIILLIVGSSMLLPIIWSLYYGDSDWTAFIISGFLTMAVGYLALRQNNLEGDFRNREALIVVTFSWLLAAVFGSLPYLLSGTLPNFADAFFETMSGFTTTGASLITDIEGLPHGILFWRSLTHWLGGMGIVVLLVAILSSLGGANGLQMFRAEAPGPVTEKIRPRISETAKVLWYTYCIMTLVEIGLLTLLGMSLFDAMCHTFGTVATGGFSTKNASIGYYQSSSIHWVIIIFMFLAGSNFALLNQVLRAKKLSAFWRNGEFRLYTSVVVVVAFLLSLNLFFKGDYSSFSLALRDASFQVVSILTTTGFATADFGAWSFIAQALLVLLMFIGGCSGSTGGSIKVGRILIIAKQSLIELRRVIHPRAVLNLKIDGKNVSQEILVSILQFFFIYMAIVAFSTIFLASLGLDLVSAFTAVAANLGNVGPGLASVGPVANYSFLPDSGKYVLSFLMMMGRLELYTVLILLVPSFWRYSK